MAVVETTGRAMPRPMRRSMVAVVRLCSCLVGVGGVDCEEGRVVVSVRYLHVSCVLCYVHFLINLFLISSSGGNWVCVTS